MEFILRYVAPFTYANSGGCSNQAMQKIMASKSNRNYALKSEYDELAIVISFATFTDF